MRPPQVYLASAFPLFLMGVVWGAFAVRLAYEVAAGFDAGHRQKLFGDHVYMSLILIYLAVPPVSNLQFKVATPPQRAPGAQRSRAACTPRIA